MSGARASIAARPRAVDGNQGAAVPSSRRARAPRARRKGHSRLAGVWTELRRRRAQPDVVGDGLGIELGIDPRIVDLLIERGSELNEPLGLAACFNRAELVRMLLEAGAQQHASEIWGITPLQTAIYHGAKEAGDLLAAVALVPDAFYVAAGAGRLDALERWFDERGALRPEALALRPNLADVGWPPLGLTGLHFAVIARRLDVVRWLVERGADLRIKDQIHDGTPLGWAEPAAGGSDVHRFLEKVG